MKFLGAFCLLFYSKNNYSILLIISSITDVFENIYYKSVIWFIFHNFNLLLFYTIYQDTVRAQYYFLFKCRELTNFSALCNNLFKNFSSQRSYVTYFGPSLVLKFLRSLFRYNRRFDCSGSKEKSFFKKCWNLLLSSGLHLAVE